MRRYIKVLKIKKSNYVKLLINLWTRVKCFNSNYEFATQYEYIIYNSKAILKKQEKAFIIEFYKREDCLDNEKSEFYSY
jgi:hypothetical protein